MEIQRGQMVFLVGHRGGVSHKINSVLLELSVAMSADDLASGRADSFTLAVPADYAEKVIASIQTSLAILRKSN